MSALFTNSRSNSNFPDIRQKTVRYRFLNFDVVNYHAYSPSGCPDVSYISGRDWATAYRLSNVLRHRHRKCERMSGTTFPQFSFSSLALPAPHIDICRGSNIDNPTITVKPAGDTRWQLLQKQVGSYHRKKSINQAVINKRV